MRPVLVVLTGVLVLVSSVLHSQRTAVAPVEVVVESASPMNAPSHAGARVVRAALTEAGDLTARVALAPDRAGRMVAARTAATQVRALIDMVRWADEGEAASHAALLWALADALDGYDLPRIAQLSDQRADAVVALERQLHLVLRAAPAELVEEVR